MIILFWPYTHSYLLINIILFALQRFPQMFQWWCQLNLVYFQHIFGVKQHQRKPKERKKGRNSYHETTLEFITINNLVDVFYLVTEISINHMCTLSFKRLIKLTVFVLLTIYIYTLPWLFHYLYYGTSNLSKWRSWIRLTRNGMRRVKHMLF